MKSLLFNFVMVVVFTGALFSQSTTVKLPTHDSTTSFVVTDNNDKVLLKIFGNDGFYMLANGGGTNLPLSGAGVRLMWDPVAAAFRVGSVSGTQWDAGNIGGYSFAAGDNTTASNTASVAIGNGTTASMPYSTAMGDATTASGNSSTAMGNSTTASGGASTAMGQSTTASGLYSTAMGDATIAQGNYSTAMGGSAKAYGTVSTALGYVTQASGDYSTAMGYYTLASGLFSTAMGDSTKASGKASTVMGYQSTASGDYSTAMGYSSQASGIASTAMGGAFASGKYATAMGFGAAATGDYSTAIGAFADANHYEGTCVISDNSIPGLSLLATLGYQMTMKFANGYILYTNSAATIGVSIAASGNSWSSISDSTKKEYFAKADGEYFLQSISQLRLGSWNYKSQDAQHYRHYGPMAQEIFHYFGKDQFGTIGNDTTLATADMDGIEMICLQALEKRTNELQMATVKIAELEEQTNELRQAREKISALEDSLNKLSAVVQTLVDEKKNVSMNVVERKEQ